MRAILAVTEADRRKMLSTGFLVYEVFQKLSQRFELKCVFHFSRKLPYIFGVVNYQIEIYFRLSPMAKKSLKKRIDDLVDALGRAQKPTFAEIRSELVSLGTLAQELEDGQALSEKEAAIAALETENENLKVELQTANAELDTFRS